MKVDGEVLHYCARLQLHSRVSSPNRKAWSEIHGPMELIIAFCLWRQNLFFPSIVYYSTSTAVLKLFGCWAKFAITSASTGRTILRIEKTKIARITLITFVYIAVCFPCSVTYLQCDLWNCFFCCVKAVIFGSTLDAAIWRVSRKSSHNRQITLTLQTPNAYYNLQISQHVRKLM